MPVALAAIPQMRFVVQSYTQCETWQNLQRAICLGLASKAAFV